MGLPHFDLFPAEEKIIRTRIYFLRERKKRRAKGKELGKSNNDELVSLLHDTSCTTGQVWASPGFLICSIKSTHFCQWKVKHKNDFGPENCTVFALHLLCTFAEYTRTQQREETQEITRFDLLTAPYSSPSNTLPGTAKLLSCTLNPRGLPLKESPAPAASQPQPLSWARSKGCSGRGGMSDGAAGFPVPAIFIQALSAEISSLLHNKEVLFFVFPELFNIGYATFLVPLPRQIVILFPDYN